MAGISLSKLENERKPGRSLGRVEKKVPEEQRLPPKRSFWYKAGAAYQRVKPYAVKTGRIAAVGVRKGVQYAAAGVRGGVKLYKAGVYQQRAAGRRYVKPVSRRLVKLRRPRRLISRSDTPITDRIFGKRR